MRRLSIVQVCADRGIVPGSSKGAAQHLRGIAAGLTDSGHDVATYAARSPAGSFPIAVHDLADLQSVDRANVDVIYERYSLGHDAGLDLARRLDATFVLEVNAPLVAEAREHRPDTVEAHHADIESRLIAEADLAIAVSSPLTRWASRQRPGPTATIANGFEPDWFDSPGPPATRPTLAFIGHPKPWHGADRLPWLLRNLADNGQRPELIIIGGGPGTEQILNRAQALGVADQITVTGALSPQEASALLSRATIGIAPYPRQEPFYFCPLKIVDYLAAGLPIVSTRQGDITDLVGDAGVVVDPDDDQALVAALSDLIANPEKARKFGANGHRRAHATMTWAHAAAATAAMICALDMSGVAT